MLVPGAGNQRMRQHQFLIPFGNQIQLIQQPGKYGPTQLVSVQGFDYFPDKAASSLWEIEDYELIGDYHSFLN
jgi:hypothetical protein